MGKRTANLRTKRRSVLGWLLPFMALAVSLGLAYGAYNLASYSWDQVVSYESPYTTQSGIDFSGRPAGPRRPDPRRTAPTGRARADRRPARRCLAHHGIDLGAPRARRRRPPDRATAEPLLPHLDDDPHRCSAADQRRHDQLVRGPGRSRDALRCRSRLRSFGGDLGSGGPRRDVQRLGGCRRPHRSSSGTTTPTRATRSSTTRSRWTPRWAVRTSSSSCCPTWTTPVTTTAVPRPSTPRSSRRWMSTSRA